MESNHHGIEDSWEGIACLQVRWDRGTLLGLVVVAEDALEVIHIRSCYPVGTAGKVVVGILVVEEAGTGVGVGIERGVLVGKSNIQRVLGEGMRRCCYYQVPVQVRVLGVLHC